MADKEFERFSRALSERLGKNPELKLQLAQNIHVTLQGKGIPSPGALSLLQRMRDDDGDGGGGGGGGGGTTAVATPITVEAFWWGFHFVIPHQALQAILIGGNAVNTFVELVGPETGPAAPFV